MIINKVEIEQFGKCKNFTLDFKGGMNTVWGENEAGKSTLCAFLLAMFYGLENESKKKSIREDARKRYLPWDGGVMAGSVYFTADGRSYVLSRRFAKTRRGDKVSLKDANTWEEITGIDPEDIGRTFLGVGEAGFTKTLFISQLGTLIFADSDDEILKRLSNLGQSGSEDFSYQAANAALEKAKHDILSKTGRGGMLYRLEQETEALAQELSESKRLSEQYKDDVLLLNSLKEKATELEETAKELIEQKKLAAAHDRYVSASEAGRKLEKLLQRREENNKRISELNEKIALFKEELKKYENISELSQQELLRLAQRETERASLVKKLEDIKKQKERLVELGQIKELESHKNGAVNNKFLLIVSFVLLVIGAISGAFVSPLLFLLIPVGVILGAVSFLGRKSKNEFSEVDREIESLKVDTDETVVIKLKEEISTIEKEISSALSGLGAENVREYAEKMQNMQNIRQEHMAAEKELSLLLDTGKQIEEDMCTAPTDDVNTFSEDAMSYSGPNVDETDALILKNNKEQMDNQREYEAVRHRVEEAFLSARSTDVILSEIEQNLQAKDELNFHYAALDKAQKALEEAYLELKRDFAPLLNEKVGEILSVLTEGKYTELKISDDYNVMLKDGESGQIVSAQYLSGGTYDIIYFALRMGIAQVIFNGQIPLMILDDTFLQLDDRRASLAAEYIKKARIEQILYFTCHNLQADLFNNDNKITL